MYDVAPSMHWRYASAASGDARAVADVSVTEVGGLHLVYVSDCLCVVCHGSPCGNNVNMHTYGHVDVSLCTKKRSRLVRRTRPIESPACAYARFSLPSKTHDIR